MEATANKNPLEVQPDTSAFSPRPPLIKLWQIALMMSVQMMLILVTILSGNEALATVTMVILTLITSFVINYMQQKITDERTSSEFMSLTLAEALRISTVLSIIVKQDGGIFYLDPRYTRNFPEAKSYHNLDNILNTLMVKQPDRREVFNKIAESSYYSHDFKFKRKLGELLGLNDLDLRLEVLPLHRPQGYIYLTISLIAEDKPVLEV